MNFFLFLLGIACLIFGILSSFIKRFKIDKKISVISGIAGVVVIILSQTFCIVSSNRTGISEKMGQISENPISSGIHFKVPFVESIHEVDNRYQKITLEERCWSETSERTPIYYENVEITYQIPSDSSYWVYANIPNYEDNIINNNLVASALKATSVSFKDADATNRGKLEPLTLKNLQKQVDLKYGTGRLRIISVIVDNADFEDEYNQALAKKNQATVNAATAQVENDTKIANAEAEKQIAQIKADTDYNTKVKEAQAEADAIYALAKKQAEANMLLNESLTDNILRSKFYDTWDGKLPEYVGGENGSFIFNMLDDANKSE